MHDDLRSIARAYYRLSGLASIEHDGNMNGERLESHRAVIGEGFAIRRALPNRQRRMVGAWCLLDHAGPADHPGGAQAGG